MYFMLDRIYEIFVIAVIFQKSKNCEWEQNIPQVTKKYKPTKLNNSLPSPNCEQEVKWGGYSFLFA